MRESVLVIGGATWDILFEVEQASLLPGKSRELPVLAFPYGGKVDAHNVTYGFGGGAANVAVGLRRLGVRADILTRVGSDWRGHEVVVNLRSHRVGLGLAQVERKHETALSFIVTTGGARDHVAFVARGASARLELPTSVPATYTWLYVTALVLEHWAPKLVRLFRQAKQQGRRVFWNPGAVQLQRPRQVAQLARYITVLDLNLEEASDLARGLRFSWRGVRELTEKLQRLGCQGVLVTAGEKGAYIREGRRFTFERSRNVEPTNTTGAGDAFGSGFVAGLISSGATLAGMRWGMLNASSVICHVGPQRGLLTKSALKRLAKRYAR